MRKFTSMQHVTLEQWPDDLWSEFSNVFNTCYKESGSLSEVAYPSQIVALPPISEKSFHNFEIAKVESAMSSIYHKFTTVT